MITKIKTWVLRWFWDTYLGKTHEDSALLATPMQATNLASLPPTLLITAENDPLRDEGIAYGEELNQASVQLKHHHFAAIAWRNYAEKCASLPACVWLFFRQL